MIIVAKMAGQGKTQKALELLVDVLVTGKNVLMYSAEDYDSTIYERIAKIIKDRQSNESFAAFAQRPAYGKLTLITRQQSTEDEVITLVTNMVKGNYGTTEAFSTVVLDCNFMNRPHWMKLGVELENDGVDVIATQQIVRCK